MRLKFIVNYVILIFLLVNFSEDTLSANKTTDTNSLYPNLYTMDEVDYH